MMDHFPTCSSNSTAFSGANKNCMKEKKKDSKSSKGRMRLSTDPQSVAARERRHRISDRFKILQSLIPGGSKLDTVSMLEKAIQYVKFLKTQIWLHETMINTVEDDPSFIFLPSQRSFFPETSLPTIEPSPTLQVQECFCQADHEILMFSDVLENYYYHEPSNI